MPTDFSFPIDPSSATPKQNIPTMYYACPRMGAYFGFFASMIEYFGKKRDLKTL